jgi:hypothetical protein
MTPQSRPNALSTMRSAIQLAGFRYIVCLKATPTTSDYQITLDKMTYAFEALRTVDIINLHADFQRWAAMAVLRDLIESFSIFMSEKYRECIEAAPAVTFSLTAQKFERCGIEEQLSIFLSDFIIDPEWTLRLTGFNRARNCLAHRQGIVGDADKNEDNELVVRWLAPCIELTRNAPTPEVVVEGPMNSLMRGRHLSGQGARIGVRDKEKRTPIGTVLSFQPADVLEICQTFQMAAAAFYSVTASKDISDALSP